VQLGAGKLQVHCAWWWCCVLSIRCPVAMNTACLLSIHSPDDVFMTR